MTKCCICHKKIKEHEQVYQMVFGDFRIDDFGMLNFDEASESMHGYIHFKCAIGIKIEGGGK